MRLGGAGQQVSALGAAPRFHEAALLQAGQNQLQELLRNLLAAGDVGNFDRLAGALRGQVEDRLQRVFTFDGNVHGTEIGARQESPLSQ